MPVVDETIDCSRRSSMSASTDRRWERPERRAGAAQRRRAVRARGLDREPIDRDCRGVGGDRERRASETMRSGSGRRRRPRMTIAPAQYGCCERAMRGGLVIAWARGGAGRRTSGPACASGRRNWRPIFLRKPSPTRSSSTAPPTRASRFRSGSTGRAARNRSSPCPRSCSITAAAGRRERRSSTSPWRATSSSAA